MRPHPSIFFCLLGFVTFLGFPASVPAQDQTGDAAVISGELLYHPALRIEAAGGALLFRAAQFTYRFDAASGEWRVTREKYEVEQPKVTRYRHAASGAEFRFEGESTDDEGFLEIFKGDETEPVARLELWNRARLAAAWIERWQRDDPKAGLEQLRDELEPSDPEVTGVADDGTHLWLAIRFYAGEGVLGMGTLVRLDPATGEAQTLQPALLRNSSLTHIAFANGALWLGTLHEGEGYIEPTVGLVRFDPATGQVKSYLGRAAGIIGHIVTAMHAAPDALWVATDAGICRIALPAESPECWRIIPKVTLAGSVPVANRPGGPPRGTLLAGSYEVRWANAASLEVLTPDTMEGWIETDDLREYRRREFDARAYDLGNTYGGGAGVMRLVDEPQGDLLRAAQVYRAAIVPVGEPDEDDWQRVRAHVGWIARGKLAVAPVLERVAP